MAGVTNGQRHVLPLVAAAVTMLLWASAFIAIRSMGPHFAPGAMALGRLLVGSVVLTLIALVRRRTLRPRRDPAGAAAAGVRTSRWSRRTAALVITYGALWFGIYTVSINAAEQHIDAGTAALVVNIGPILIAILAGLFLGEGFPRNLLLGCAVALTGVTVIAVATSTGRLDAVGVLFAFGSAVCYAVSVVLQKQALAGGIDPVTTTWLGCLAGATVCLPFAPQLLHDLANAPRTDILGVAYLGVFPTALAFLFWAYALAHTSAGRLGSSSYLVPGLAVLMSWGLLSEVPSELALIGGALCLAGVAVARLPARRRETSPAQ
jgi:drug/metabolite transporter (DMT)-like permease